MDHELPLNDERKPPKKGSITWTLSQVALFRKLSKEHGGLTSPNFCAVALGVSRQRVHQLMEAGHLPSVEILGRPYVLCDQLEEFAALQRTSGTRYAASPDGDLTTA